MRILTKVSPKEVMGKVAISKFMNPKLGEIRKLYRVLGSVTDTLDKDSNFGVSIALVGDFRGVVYNDDGTDGPGFVGRLCYLSKELSFELKSQLLKSKEEQQEELKDNPDMIPYAKSVEFAFDISIVTVVDRGGVDGALSYEFLYDAHLEMETNNRLEDLERRVAENMGLSAPKETPALSSPAARKKKKSSR